MSVDMELDSKALETARKSINAVRVVDQFGYDCAIDHVLSVAIRAYLEASGLQSKLDEARANEDDGLAWDSLKLCQGKLKDAERERDEARKKAGRSYDEANRYVNEMIDAKAERNTLAADIAVLREVIAALRKRIDNPAHHHLSVDALCDAALSNQSTASLKAGGDGGWISWAGGECPVPDGTSGEFRLANGNIEPFYNMADANWANGHDGPAPGYEIAAYRVTNPSQPADGQGERGEADPDWDTRLELARKAAAPRRAARQLQHAGFSRAKVWSPTPSERQGNGGEG